MRSRLAAAPTASALALLAAGLTLTLWLPPWADESISDLPLYAEWARAFMSGSLPYRDVPFEYPPLAAPVVALGGLLGTSRQEYALGFGLLSLILAAVLVVLTGRLAALAGADPRRAMLGAAALPLLLGAVIRTHYDLAPTVLAVAGLVAVLERRDRLGFALLGLGTMTKAFPLLTAAVALAWLWGRGERERVRRGVLALAVAIGVVAAAAVLASPEGAVDAVRYHLERPLQIESAPAAILLAWEAAGGEAAVATTGFRSDGLAHPAAEPLRVLFVAILAATLAFFVLAARTLATPRALVLAGLAVVAALPAFGTVLSPQFLVWVAPLFALALAARERALATATGAAMLLTLVEFPGLYLELLAREEVAVAVVVLRDVALIAAVALAGRALAHEGRRDEDRISSLRAGSGPTPSLTGSGARGWMAETRIRR